MLELSTSDDPMDPETSYFHAQCISEYVNFYKNSMLC